MGQMLAKGRLPPALVFILFAASLSALPSPVIGDDTAVVPSAPEPAAPAEFPEPLRVDVRSEEGPAKSNREQAADCYLRGRDEATRKRDYVSALLYFEKALSFETTSTALYAAAHCKRVLNRPVEALFAFANAIHEDSRMAPADRLPEHFVRAAGDGIDEIMGRFVEARVSLPKGARLEHMSLGGVPLMSTNLFGHAKRNILLAAPRPDGVPSQPAVLGDGFSFYVTPGTYDVVFILADGRRLSIEKRRITPESRVIDLDREALPAQIVVENIQPGMRVVVRGMNDSLLLDEEFPERRARLAIGGLKGGEYDLLVSRAGFRDFSATFHLSKAQSESVALDLRPKPLVASWKLWLGVGLVVAAGIAASAAIVATRDDEKPAKSGTGTVSVGVF